MSLLANFVDGIVDRNSRMLKAIEKMSDQSIEQMTGLRTEIKSLKDILMHCVAAENKKQPRINGVEDMLAKKWPDFKKALHRGTLSPVLFGQLTRLIVKTYMPEVVDIHRTKRMLDLLMLSTRDGKLVYTTEVGRDAKALRRSIVKKCISNAKLDVFAMFSSS